LGARENIWVDVRRVNSGVEKNYTIGSLMIHTAHTILIGWTYREEWDEWGM